MMDPEPPARTYLKVSIRFNPTIMASSSTSVASPRETCARCLHRGVCTGRLCACRAGFTGERCAVLSATDSGGCSSQDTCQPATRQLEVFIPFYERDICAMKYLGRSIERHGGDVLGDVHLGWTSSRPLAQFRAQVAGLQRSFGPQRAVHVIDMHPLARAFSRLPNVVDRNGDRSGWYAQQAAKLQVAEVIRSRHYLVLDAKNAFMRTVEFGDFYSPCGRPLFEDLGGLQAMPPIHRSWYSAAATLLNLSHL